MQLYGCQSLPATGDLHHTLGNGLSISTKKIPNPNKVPIWRPKLIKDIVQLGKIERSATKYILHNSTHDRMRLISLEILLLMMWSERADRFFLFVFK